MTENEIFYNTVNLFGDELKKSTQRAESQNKRIEKIMIEHRLLTPSRVWAIFQTRYPNERILLTSVRRCLSSDTTKYEKTPNKIMGPYNELEHYYRARI